MPFPTPGDLPDPGIKPMSLYISCLADGFFTTEPPGKLWRGLNIFYLTKQTSLPTFVSFEVLLLFPPLSHLRCTATLGADGTTSTGPVFTDADTEVHIRNCPQSFIFLFSLRDSFLYGRTGSSFLCEGLVQLQRAGPSFGVQASHCGGFLSFRARALGTQASLVAVRGLTCLSTWAWQS